MDIIRPGNNIIGNAGARFTLPRRSGAAGFVPVNAETVTLLAAMTTQPDDTRAALIDGTITDLKDGGIWAKLDELWFTAAHTEQAGLLGWKRLKDLTAVNAPTFTVDRGFAGNGTTSYLNTNYVPSTDGVQYTLNDASLGLYSRTNSAGDLAVEMGVQIGGGGRSTCEPRDLSSRIRFSVNSAVNVRSANNTVTDSSGLFVSRRTTSTALSGLRNGSVIATATDTANSLPNLAIFLCSYNIDGNADGFSTRQLAFSFVGASMTTGEQSNLFDIVEAHLDAIGAGVIA
jgi:hypothetical protein